MRAKKLRWLLALLAATAMVVAACGDDDGSSASSDDAASDEGGGDLEKTDLTVGVIPINDILPLPAGINDGTFEDAGLTVEMAEAAGGAAIIPGVESGDYDIGFSNVYSVLKAAEQGLDVKIIAAGPYVGDTGETDFSGLTTMDPAITSVEDLEGKTVTVNTLSGIAEFAVRETLAQSGVEDVNLIEVPFPETTAAMESGEVDAAFQVEPFVGQAERAGARVLAQPFSAAQPDMLVAVWFTTGSFIDENPNTVAAFVDAMNQSNEKVQSDRDFANEQLLTYTPTPNLDAAAATTLPVFKSEIDSDSLEESVEIGKKYEFFESDADLDELVYKG